MDKIAFIIGETFLYWNSIFLVLAVVTGCLLFLGFYLGRSGNTVGAFLALPLFISLSIVLARLVHWYCQADSYKSMITALTNYLSGGYALCGAFAGCILGAVLLRLCKAVKDLPEMLDCMALAGAAAIGVGRLGCLFTSADRGNILEEAWRFPYAWPITNAVTGATENRLAVFMLQAMFCGALFVLLTLFWLLNRRRNRSGDTCLLFLLFYGASQAVLDSMRYDSLFLRSNGFVSLVQILGAVAVVIPVVIISVRSVRLRKLRVMHPILWLLTAAGLGGAGYMEYYVQRHGNQALFSYTIMSLCMTAVAGITLFLYFHSGKKNPLAKII